LEHLNDEIHTLRTFVDQEQRGEEDLTHLSQKNIDYHSALQELAKEIEMN
jgi:hypothetical protein